MKDKANTTKLGERGKRGKRGYDGAKGIAGTNGTTGLSGNPGKNGTNGLPGKDAVTSDLVFSDCLLFLRSSGILINTNYIPHYYASWNDYCSQMHASIILTNAGRTKWATDAVTRAGVCASNAIEVAILAAPNSHFTTDLEQVTYVEAAQHASRAAEKLAYAVAAQDAIMAAVQDASMAVVDAAGDAAVKASEAADLATDATEAAFYLLLQAAFLSLQDYYWKASTGQDSGGSGKKGGVLLGSTFPLAGMETRIQAEMKAKIQAEMEAEMVALRKRLYGGRGGGVAP